jgi:uncharacterized protein YkwD
MSHAGSTRWIAVGTGLAVLGILATTLMARPAAAAPAQLIALGDPGIVHMIAVEQALLELTNADRAAHGLAPLDFDPETLLIARERAAAQLGQDNLSHYDEQGALAFVRLLDDAVLKYGLAGENLARGTTGGEDITERIEQALMKSPAHRKNILETRFVRAAIGAAVDRNGRIAFAEIFRGD